jgi:predicted phage terminase large subunit-like protein
MPVSQELRKAAAKELLDLHMTRTSTAKLYARLYPQFKLAAFHKKKCEILDKFVNGKIKRLIINEPPRHIKSVLGSIVTPAAFIGNYPDKQIIGGSYNTDLAKLFGRSVRNTVDTWQYQRVYEGVRLRKDSKSAGRWNTNQDGIYLSAAVEKPVTGFGADRLLIDDPHADYTAGNDLRQTQKDFDWFKSLYTRKMPGCGIAIIMQRMSTHDLTARALGLAKEKKEEWTHINFPAISDDDGKAIRYDGTPAGLKVLGKGHALWPEQFNITELLDTAWTLGASEFNAQYQQLPDNVSGQIIQAGWLSTWSDRATRAEGRIPIPPKTEEFDMVLQSWDLRLKGDSKNDPRTSFVVGQVWGFKGADAFLLDQVRGQWGFENSCLAIQALSSRWPQARIKIIENKANGPAAEEKLRRKVSGLRLVDPFSGDKEARLRACETEFAARNVHFPPPETHDWVHGFVQRLLNFPAHPNDEGDALSQALNWHYMKRNKLKELGQ